jgi:hypothetical protein
MLLSEAGTTFIDLITAVPALAAYTLLLVRGRLFFSARLGRLGWRPAGHCDCS